MLFHKYSPPLLSFQALNQMPGMEVAPGGRREPCPQPELVPCPGLTLRGLQGPAGWDQGPALGSSACSQVAWPKGRPQSIYSKTGSGLFTKCLPSSGRKSLPARWFSFLFFFFPNSFWAHGLEIARVVSYKIRALSLPRLLREKTDTAFPEGTLTLNVPGL